MSWTKSLPLFPLLKLAYFTLIFDTKQEVIYLEKTPCVLRERGRKRNGESKRRKKWRMANFQLRDEEEEEEEEGSAPEWERERRVIEY